MFFAILRQQFIHLGLINSTSDPITDQIPTQSSIINETLANVTETYQTNAIKPTAVLKHDILHDTNPSSIEPLSSSMESIKSIESMASVANPPSQSISHKPKRSMSSNQSTQTVLQSTISNAQIKANDAEDASSRNGRKINANKLNRNDGAIGRINVVIHNISVITDMDYSDESNQG